MSDSEWVVGLSPMEKDLLDKLAAGLTVKRAAPAALMSLRTANRCLTKLRNKVGVVRTSELVWRYKVARDE